MAEDSQNMDIIDKMEATPSFKFYRPGTLIHGYVTAQTVQEAAEMLKCINFMPLRLTNFIGGTHAYEGAKFEIEDKHTVAVPILLSEVKIIPAPENYIV